MPLPRGTWHFRGQEYSWDPDTYKLEYDHPAAKRLFRPELQPVLDTVHGEEFDKTWSDFVGPFTREIFLHGCAFWVILPLFIVTTSFSVTCVGGPSPVFLLLLGGLLLGLSVAHEVKMMMYRQAYYSIRDIYAPAHLAKGLDSWYLQYGFSVLRQLGFATYGLLIPQIFACGNTVADRYVELWRDSLFRMWAVPLFQHAPFSLWVVGIYVVSVLGMQGFHGWMFWRGVAGVGGSNCPFAADVESLADWAGMLALSSAFHRLNKMDIEDQAAKGCPPAILRTREGELTAMAKIQHSTITVSLPQIYVSMTMVQLTFDLKSNYGQLVVAGTSLLSLASAIKKSWPGVSFIMDDLRWRGRLMFAVTLVACMFGAYKLAGAFVCESHLTVLLPPHCIDTPPEWPWLGH